ncbi:hypothetical protein BC829DRAFT_405806 [Chytridium lagenaria]|nr:hypothetical protein BC829DRAFT_405806 [Chytridium lagenaria]
MSLGGHDDEHGGRGFQYNLAAGSRSHSEPTYSEDDNETVTAGMMAADNMSRKIDAGIVLLATIHSPGFQKHVPVRIQGFGVNELKRLNDCFIVSVGGKNLQTAAAQQTRTLASNFSYLRQAQDNMQKSFESSLLALKERLDNFDEKLETIRGSFFLLQAL